MKGSDHLLGVWAGVGLAREEHGLVGGGGAGKAHSGGADLPIVLSPHHRLGVPVGALPGAPQGLVEPIQVSRPATSSRL